MTDILTFDEETHAYTLGGRRVPSVTEIVAPVIAGKHADTNADRIRQMSDEELAEWMAIKMDCSFCKVKNKNKNICFLDDRACTKEWLFWLKSPADKGGDE